jgi:hypothetical protein
LAAHPIGCGNLARDRYRFFGGVEFDILEIIGERLLADESIAAALGFGLLKLCPPPPNLRVSRRVPSGITVCNVLGGWWLGLSDRSRSFGCVLTLVGRLPVSVRRAVAARELPRYFRCDPAVTGLTC